MTKEMIVILIYSIGVNLALFALANSGIPFNCDNPMMSVYNTTYNSSALTYEQFGRSHTTIIDLAFPKCNGLPTWIIYIAELPVIIGLLYIIRQFIGAT